jgi:hypothetical protein
VFLPYGSPREEIACDNLSQSFATPQRTIAGASDQGLSAAWGWATLPLKAILVERKLLTFQSGPSWVLLRMPEMNMAKSDQPLVGLSDVMTQNFEQTDAADLKRKIKDYLEKNIAAANEFIRKLSEAKDSQSFWRIQIDFMQTQWKMLSEQMKDPSEMATRSVTGAFKNIAA